MKKRVLACVLMLVFVLASAMTVSAAESKGNGSKAAGVRVTSPSDKFEAVTSDVKFEGASTDVTNKVKDMTAVTSVFEIAEVDGGKTLPTDITLEVDALGDKVESVVLVVKGKDGWKAIDAKVDGKKVTASFSEIGPVIVYAKVASGSGAGTSPSTAGTSSAWMIMAAVALIAVGAGVVVSQKKSR